MLYSSAPTLLDGNLPGFEHVESMACAAVSEGGCSVCLARIRCRCTAASTLASKARVRNA